MAVPEPVDAPDPIRLRIAVEGAVQGVGFRPFVYRRAAALGLAGWVRNTPRGLLVEAEGAPAAVHALLDALRTAPPRHAAVTRVDPRAVPPAGQPGFAILESLSQGSPAARVLPDLATCGDCLAELFDPADRRYRYPFVNCTACGPRYTIVERLPYDRGRTSMKGFALCAACQAEYENPADRRFHAEPNACPVCGPRLALQAPDGRLLAERDAALHAAAAALAAGRIVAVKGVGGFHLLTDARDERAVRRLRQLKRRPGKPFAVLFGSLEALRVECRVSPLEAALLAGPARPIVLLRRTGAALADAVAPDLPSVGALLPYSGLHHLLLRELGFPVVATSANAAGEPLVFDEAEAVQRLGGLADLFLVHDRPILRPVDDSVVRVAAGRALVLRAGRGHAPTVVALPGAAAGTVALGGHLKTSVAATAAGSAVLSQHVGDLASHGLRAAHAAVRADLVRTHALPTRLLVHDLHPDYATTRTAQMEADAAAGRAGGPAADRARPTARPRTLGVQHHVAHVAACAAEHGVAPPLLGVAFDGGGFGPDGTIWGGEFLVLAGGAWRRVAHLRGFALPGGDAAVLEPRRAALGLLYEAFGERAFALRELAPLAAFTPAERRVLRRALERNLNAPRCSSVGRLFDAFAALTDLVQRARYEAEAASALEWAADGIEPGRGYPFALREGAPLVLDWQPALEAALADSEAGTAPGAISAALHFGLADAIAAVARRIGERRVALTGGCFQNARLTAAAVRALERVGLEPLRHERVPPNDGGLALGQAAWAAWSLARETAAEREGASPCA